MHTHTHTHTHAHAHAHTSTHTHTHTFTHKQAHKHTNTHTIPSPCTHIQIHTAQFCADGIRGGDKRVTSLRLLSTSKQLECRASHAHSLQSLLSGCRLRIHGCSNNNSSRGRFCCPDSRCSHMLVGVCVDSTRVLGLLQPRPKIKDFDVKTLGAGSICTRSCG